MATFTARRKTHEVVSAKEYLKRHKKDPNSVQGAKILVPRKLGQSVFGKFLVKKDVPVYEVL